MTSLLLLLLYYEVGRVTSLLLLYYYYEVGNGRLRLWGVPPITMANHEEEENLSDLAGSLCPSGAPPPPHPVPAVGSRYGGSHSHSGGKVRATARTRTRKQNSERLSKMGCDLRHGASSPHWAAAACLRSVVWVYQPTNQVAT